MSSLEARIDRMLANAKRVTPMQKSVRAIKATFASYDMGQWIRVGGTTYDMEGAAKAVYRLFKKGRRSVECVADGRTLRLDASRYL